MGIREDSLVREMRKKEGKGRRLKRETREDREPATPKCSNINIRHVSPGQNTLYILLNWLYWGLIGLYQR